VVTQPKELAQPAISDVAGHLASLYTGGFTGDAIGNMGKHTLSFPVRFSFEKTTYIGMVNKGYLCKKY
jgi:hypothetical protein